MILLSQVSLHETRDSSRVYYAICSDINIGTNEYVFDLEDRQVTKIESTPKNWVLVHGVHKNLKLKFQDISRTFQDKNYVFPGQFLPVENHGEN